MDTDETAIISPSPEGAERSSLNQEAATVRLPLETLRRLWWPTGQQHSPILSSLRLENWVNAVWQTEENVTE